MCSLALLRYGGRFGIACGGYATFEGCFAREVALCVDQEGVTVEVFGSSTDVHGWFVVAFARVVFCAVASVFRALRGDARSLSLFRLNTNTKAKQARAFTLWFGPCTFL